MSASVYYHRDGSGVVVSERSHRAARLALLLQRLDASLINLHQGLNPDRLPLDDRGPWRHNEVMWESDVAHSLGRQAMRLTKQNGTVPDESANDAGGVAQGAA